MSMFCYQCEQTARGKTCDSMGVCGKNPDVSALQDLLVFQVRGISFYCSELEKKQLPIAENMYEFIIQALFTTVTNVNFDPKRLFEMIRKAEKIRIQCSELAQKAGISMSNAPESALFSPSNTDDAVLTEAYKHGLLSGAENDDIRSLKHILLFGLKGMAAYADHAHVLGKKDTNVHSFFVTALQAINRKDIGMEELVSLCMKCGEINIRTMELLNQGHIEHYGNPEPTQVSTGTVAGPAIVVSGHDLLDLEHLLKQTDGKGVSIYTHGEMLPAHGYPGLKKYKHLAGHFGTAWQNQQKEFDNVPAAFLFTTNCIQKPKESYADRVFTTGLVAFPGLRHVQRTDFSAVIEKAKQLGGFQKKEGKKLLTGFGHHAVLSVADKVIDAVKKGAIRHFFLVGGCDGAKPGRNYYTDFVEKSPKDTLILTLACGKFRFNHLDIGDIGGIPRILDIGQCNDAYSAVKIAQALAGAFNCGINDLPLSLILSWYEQKAVVILLSLLHLGIKNIRLGPSLPAFITPNVLNFLVQNFNIMPVSENAQKDLDAILKK